MFFKKMFAEGAKEETVLQEIRRHICLLNRALGHFKSAMEKKDAYLMRRVGDLERDADVLRREIIYRISEGAFLPYFRPDLCRYVELADSIFDMLADTAVHWFEAKIPESLLTECLRVAFLNLRIAEMLLLTYDAMLNGEDLRDKTLAIRIYEKKIDDIKFALFRSARRMPVENFWDAKSLSDFLTGLTAISDLVEDASDHLQIIRVSLR